MKWRSMVPRSLEINAGVGFFVLCVEGEIEGCMICCRRRSLYMCIWPRGWDWRTKAAATFNRVSNRRGSFWRLQAHLQYDAWPNAINPTRTGTDPAHTGPITICWNTRCHTAPHTTTRAEADRRPRWRSLLAR